MDGSLYRTRYFFRQFSLLGAAGTNISSQEFRSWFVGLSEGVIAEGSFSLACSEQPKAPDGASLPQRYIV
jgi:hypothetical protein